MSPTPRPGAQVQGHTHCISQSPGTRDPRVLTKQQRDVGGDLEGESWCPQRPHSSGQSPQSQRHLLVHCCHAGVLASQQGPSLSPHLLVSSIDSLQVKCSCDSLKDPPFSERKRCALTRLAFSLLPQQADHTGTSAVHSVPCQRPVEGKELSVARGTPPCSAQQQAAGV